MEIDLIQLIGTLGGLVTGGLAGMLSKSGRIKAKSDAMKSMAEAYEMRIKALHTVIDNNNKTEIEHSRRISELNHALDDKTARIRDLTDKEQGAQRELNRANERITALTEERDQERSYKEYYKQWKCIKSQCNDPDGRRPPNSKLADQTFVDPEKGRGDNHSLQLS